MSSDDGFALDVFVVWNFRWTRNDIFCIMFMTFHVNGILNIIFIYNEQHIEMASIYVQK